MDDYDGSIYFFNKNNLEYQKINTTKRKIFNYFIIFISSITIILSTYLLIFYNEPLKYYELKKDYNILNKELNIINTNSKINYEKQNILNDSIKKLINQLIIEDTIFIKVHSINNKDIKEYGIGGTSKLFNKTKTSNIIFNGINNEMRFNHSLLKTEYLINDLLEYKNYINLKPSIKPFYTKDLKDNYISPIGNRYHPIFKEKRYHQGIDITLKENSNVLSSGSGIIEKTDFDNGYGNFIVINHGYGYKTLYAHLNKIIVKENQKINKGDLIALSGNTGRSTGAHLHYEIHNNNKILNPIDYISDFNYEISERILGGN